MVGFYKVETAHYSLMVGFYKAETAYYSLMVGFKDDNIF